MSVNGDARKFTSGGVAWLFSFLNIATALNFNAAAVRRALQSRRAA